MNGWLIAGAVVLGIVLLIVLLLCGRAAVIFDYGGTFRLTVKYMCFTIFKLPAKKKTTKKKDKKVRKTAKKKVKKEKSKLDLKSLSLSEMLELVRQALSGAGTPIKKVLKKTVISHLSIQIICGGEDAAGTAVKFGALNIAVGSALGWVDSFFTLKPLDNMKIDIDYSSEETFYDCYFEARLTLFAALAFLITVLKTFTRLMDTVKEKSNDKVK